MAGIKIGDYVVFDPLNIKVKVATDDSVEYDNRIFKLSPFVGTFLPEDKQIPSKSYQGPKFFSYNGKVLDDLRRSMEQNSDMNTSYNVVSSEDENE